MSKMITQSTLTTNGIDLKTPVLPHPPRRVTLGPAPEKLIVACVWWGTKYGVEYVEKLRNSVARNLSVPYEFVCITDREDVPEGVRAIPTPVANELCQSTNSYGDGKGWWAKVGLFKPGLFGDATRIMYLDLDVVVCGSLDRIACSQESFCMIENFGPNKGHAAHNSSLVLWTPSERTDRIYEKFSPEVTVELHGDQCWIWRVMDEDIYNYPKSWAVSYKYEKAGLAWQNANQETAVIVFHGKPDPHEVTDQVVLRNWR